MKRPPMVFVCLSVPSETSTERLGLRNRLKGKRFLHLPQAGDAEGINHDGSGLRLEPRGFAVGPCGPTEYGRNPPMTRKGDFWPVPIRFFVILPQTSGERFIDGGFHSPQSPARALLPF
jgi:hypothetical protein